MTELAFTKSFLSALDARPVKLRSDHVVDPQTIGLRGPFTLPRLPHPHPPMPKKIKTEAAPGSLKSVTVHLKSARNPVLEFSIDNAPLSTTTVHDLREAVRERVVAGDGSTNEPVPADKIKILYKKKPVGGSPEKTLAEILTESEPEVLSGGKTVEFGVMIMGGASIKPATAATETPSTVPSPPKPAEVLSTDAFWTDLEGFLEKRIRDQPEAARLAGVFRRAWEAEASR
ncbi:hypothetical protein VTN77DRAFT_7066 [Rasamsonia byssochlamydoides]|uniref:uncharacterized protein n=1 Tax=Rasamsonia byssochlamydoides TaxID=89139 RepID=UPI00374429A7